MKCALPLCLLVVCACKKTEEAPARPAGKAPEKIVVGATLSISSAEGLTARLYREGYELAFEEVNRAGGVQIAGRKVPLALEIADDGGDPARGVAEMRSLIGKKASFFLGSSSDRVVEAQAELAEKEQLLYVSPGGGSKALFERGYKWLFSLQAPVELLAYTQMRWVDEQQKAGHLPTPLTVAVLAEDSPEGRAFQHGVIEFAQRTPSRKASYKVVLDESFRAGTSDFSAPLKRLKSAGADVFVANGSLGEFLALHRQYLAMRLCHKVIGYGAHGSELQAVEAFGFDGLSYVLSAVWWSSRIARQGLARRFLESFKETYHREPDWYGALTYEAARGLIAAIQQAGTDDRAQVRDKMARMKLESILPGQRLLFDGQQRAVYPFVVQQAQPDGTSPVVFPRDVAESPGVSPNPRCR